MSAVLTKLMVPIFLFVLIINFYLRFRILKTYQKLNKADINIDPKIMFDKEKVEKFIKTNHPDHHKDILQFKTQLRNLIYLAAGGLLAILIIFLIVHQN